MLPVTREDDLSLSVVELLSDGLERVVVALDPGRVLESRPDVVLAPLLVPERVAEGVSDDADGGSGGTA